MAKWSCPLCCNKSFDSSDELKGHLEYILENLMCPMCNIKFNQLKFLIEHLDSNCEIHDFEEDERNVGPEESILAKALLEGTKPKTEETQYYCQTCEIDFTDIDSHLRDFHEGQEIIVEDEITLDPASTNEEQSVVLVTDSLDQSEDEETSHDETPPTQKLNTVIEEDIQDKDGRLYTRRFVKIDKFWLQDEPDLVEYTIEKKPDDKKILGVTLCKTCKVYYPTNETFLHKCDEKPKGIQFCEICNTTFPSFKSLRLHRRMHEPIKSRGVEAPANYEEGEEPMRQMFICKICHKTYDKEYEQAHLSSHDSNNEFNCDVCNRKFYTKSNLDMHLKAHINNKKFTCSYCKKSFVTYDSLSDHLVNQCSQKRAYACQYCGRRFARPHEKVKHERIHTGEKPHVCEICGKAFRVSYCLTLHLRTHSGTRPYQCNHCGKRFKSHSVYNHHLMTHSEVRAYKCPYCPKAFKTSVQLAGHKNSHIKPFTCTDCNRPFASLYAVRAHMETHKRDNNLKYECWICGALYSRAFALRDHLKHQHQQGEEKAKVEAAGEELGAANSILVNEEDIILGLDDANIEIIENEAE